VVSQTTVLVIDDDPVILRLLRVNFEIEGFRVISAADGADGLARLQGERPDVVISDVMMPGLDGLGVLAAIRKDPETAHVPVILLSAKAQAADIERGLDLGADEYVTKPFDPMDLIDRVNAVVAKTAL